MRDLLLWHKFEYAPELLERYIQIAPSFMGNTYNENASIIRGNRSLCNGLPRVYNSRYRFHRRPKSVYLRAWNVCSIWIFDFEDNVISILVYFLHLRLFLFGTSTAWSMRVSAAKHLNCRNILLRVCVDGGLSANNIGRNKITKSWNRLTKSALFTPSIYLLRKIWGKKFNFNRKMEKEKNCCFFNPMSKPKIHIIPIHLIFLIASSGFRMIIILYSSENREFSCELVNLRTWACAARVNASNDETSNRFKLLLYRNAANERFRERQRKRPFQT